MEVKENGALGDRRTQTTGLSSARGSPGDMHPHQRGQNMPEAGDERLSSSHSASYLTAATTTSLYSGVYPSKCPNPSPMKAFSHSNTDTEESSSLSTFRNVPFGTDTATGFPTKNQRSAMARRNERERKRVRMVNHGFATLRQYLPQGNSRKKLSKMETLRSAIEYIKQLQLLLDQPYSNIDFSSDTSHTTDRGWTLSQCSANVYGSSQGLSWEDSMGWTNPGSPCSAGSSPHTSISPDVELIDFSSFS